MTENSQEGGGDVFLTDEAQITGDGTKTRYGYQIDLQQKLPPMVFSFLLNLRGAQNSSPMVFKLLDD